MSESKVFTIFQAAKDLVTGRLEIASPELTQKRQSICDGCEVQNVVGICTACGCVIKAKVRLEKSTCPMELW